jgi:hypothetical protein
MDDMDFRDNVDLLFVSPVHRIHVVHAVPQA